MALLLRSTPHVQYIRCSNGKSEGWNGVGSALKVFGLLLMGCQAVPVLAQSLTPDPGTWRPLTYSNLQNPTARDATYVDIWKDAIDANNQSYVERGDRRFSEGNAPATESHFVIWSSNRSVVLSMLNTALGCSQKESADDAGVSIKLCPMRVTIYDGVQVRTMEAGHGCFLEPAPGARLDPSASAAYGAYDIATRTVRLGMIVNHRAVDGCSFNIPLLRE